MSTPRYINYHFFHLFFVVARNRGVTNAAKAMPYGIQQPAVSEGIATLEAHLGTKLFCRDPFRLTEAGAEVFAFIEPFFSGIDGLVDKIRHPGAPLLRIGGPEFILQHFVPPLLEQIKHRRISFRYELRSGSPKELRRHVKDGELDLAIVALGKPPAALEVLPVARLPLVLLAPAASPVPSLLRPGAVHFPLICPGSEDGICQSFQDELARRKVKWAPTTMADSIPLVSWFVGEGHGLGLCVGLPTLGQQTNLQVLPLEGFPPVEIAALTLPEPTPPVKKVLAVIRICAPRLWPKPRIAPKPPVPSEIDDDAAPCKASEEERWDRTSTCYGDDLGGNPFAPYAEDKNSPEAIAARKARRARLRMPKPIYLDRPEQGWMGE